MNSVRAILRDKFVLIGAFFVLLPSLFQWFYGQSGQIVLASPYASDKRFEKTVLYMIEHTIDGAGALVINRLYPADRQAELPVYLKGRTFPVYWGGPVSDKDQVFVMTLRGEKRPLVQPFDIAIAENPDLLKKVEQSSGQMRIIVGYVGWQAMQFELERIHHVWVLGAPRQDILRLENLPLRHQDEDEMWRQALKQSGFFKRPIGIGKS